MDPYDFLRIVRNSDGSLTRNAFFPNSPPTGDNPAAAEGDPPVLSKDVPLNTSDNTYLRLYLPSNHNNRRLPIIVQIHGGGFILFSAAATIVHHFCNRFAAELPALVVSVEYRLAPEHPLPAAYDDAVDAIQWIRDQAVSPEPDPWISLHGDFSKCFLLGSSAGGNIAYHAGIRSLDMDLHPLQIEGLILNQPFFGGEERTDSELKGENDQVLPLPATDLMWELSLPTGADRDHEFSNPMKHHQKKRMPRCLVHAYGGDPLVDRQKEVVAMLEGWAAAAAGGGRVVAVFREGGCHGAEVVDEKCGDLLVGDVKSFVYPSN